MTGITQYIPLPTARMAVFTPGQNASPGRGLLSLKTLAVHASKANSPGSFHHSVGREWLQLVRRGIGGFMIRKSPSFGPLRVSRLPLPLPPHARGFCEYPSLSWLGPDPDGALAGIKTLVVSVKVGRNRELVNGAFRAWIIRALRLDSSQES